MNEILLMGHRGWPAKYPENTLLSFKKSLDLGIDIIEFDVHLSADGIPVVIHDDDVKRTTNGSGKVCELPFSELKKLDAGAWKSPEFAGERIPSLEETLNLLAKYPRVLLNVEIKIFAEETIRRTIRMIEEKGMMSRSYFACFNAEALHAIKRIDPKLKTQGFPSKMMGNFRRGKDGTYANMDYIGIYFGDLTKEMVEFYQDIGIICGAWCVDNKESLDKCLSIPGLSVVTSNAPDLILDLLKGRSRK